MTFLSFKVLSSTTTRADFLSLPFQTENHTSSPALLYSGCTTRLAPSPRSAHSAMGRTVKGASSLSILKTATDWLSFSTELRAVST